jgi:hypothetical protein
MSLYVLTSKSQINVCSCDLNSVGLVGISHYICWVRTLDSLLVHLGYKLRKYIKLSLKKALQLQNRSGFKFV